MSWDLHQLIPNRDSIGKWRSGHTPDLRNRAVHGTRQQTGDRSSVFSVFGVAVSRFVPHLSSRIRLRKIVTVVTIVTDRGLRPLSRVARVTILVGEPGPYSRAQ